MRRKHLFRSCHVLDGVAELVAHVVAHQREEDNGRVILVLNHYHGSYNANNINSFT